MKAVDRQQADFDFSRGQGETAAQACVAKAEDVAGFDVVGARARVLYQLQIGDLSGEDLVDALKLAGFRPHDDRAFGAVFGWLVKRRKIRCVGYCPRRRGHGTAGGRIWSLAI